MTNTHLILASLSMLLAIALYACVAEAPAAINYEMDHQRLIAAGHYKHVAGYYDYQAFTEANRGN